MSEDDLIRWLRAQDPKLQRALGDDVAAPPPLAAPVATVDSQIEGVHFPKGLDPALVARRLLAVNLSDLAAAGASPRWALLALTTPPSFDHRRFFLAFLAAAEDVGLELLGGDLAQASAVVATLTVVGEGKGPAGSPLRRCGAVAGDRLWLGATVGYSSAGRYLLQAGATVAANADAPQTSHLEITLPPKLPPPLTAIARRCLQAHLLPQPQLALGSALANLALGHASASSTDDRISIAAMDLSDGIARDLPRLAAASGVGAVVNTEALFPPAAEHDFIPLCRWLGRDPLELALTGGEDYALLFSLPAAIAPPPLASAGDDGAFPRPIGHCTADGRLLLVGRKGVEGPWPEGGWDHLSS